MPFDLRPANGATVADLDLDYIKRHYLPRAVSPEVLAENRRTLAEQMRSLRLVVGDVPTNGAMLAFGRNPQWWLLGSEVQYVRFDGEDRAAPIKASETLTGRLDDMLNSVNRLLKLNIETRLDIASGPRERRFPDYPVEALRQLAFNAVMHRSYEGTHAPARLYWFSRRVEIESPGGLFGRVTPENRALKRAEEEAEADLVLVDVGPNLGAIKRGGSHRRRLRGGAARARSVLAPGPAQSRSHPAPVAQGSGSSADAMRPRFPVWPTWACPRVT